MSKNFISGVYFILNEETKLIKIGCSKDINKRYNDLQRQNEHLGYSNKLVLLDKILVDNFYDLEQFIHSRFSEERVINEWFNITLEDIKSIKEELGDNSFRGFDSGYIKTDRNASDSFLQMGLSYSQIGVLFHLKDFIDTKNMLTLDEKPMSQQDIANKLNIDRVSVYRIFKILIEMNIISAIKNNSNSKNNAYIINPRYFRLSNYEVNNEYEELFINDNIKKDLDTAF